MNDLEMQVSLDKKLKEWPKAVFDKKIDFGSGVGQRFMELKNNRNGLIHFYSTYEPLEAPGYFIHGLADTSAFDLLGAHSAYKALETVEQFIAEVFKLRGINNKNIASALHAWTGKPQG